MGANHFFKGLSWLLLLNLLVKPVWIFVIDRQVQNVVGHEAYGTYFALLNLCYVLLFIADAGLSNMLMQKLPATENLNVRQLIGLKGVMVALYASTCMVAGFVAGITEWHILGYLIAVQALTSVFLFLRSLQTARQHFKADAFFSVLDKALLLVLCAGPLYGFFRPMTITLFVQLQTISLSVAVMALALVLAGKNEFTTGTSIRLQTIGAWTAPFVVIILLMSAHNRLDAFLLERLHPDGARQAGIYAMAYRLLDAGNVAGYLTASFLVPFLARHKHQQQVLQRTILLSRHCLLLLAAGVVAFVFIFANWLVQLLYHTTDAYSATVMQLCLFSLPAYYLIHVYGAALTATARFRPFIGVLLVSVAGNILLNSWLIPAYGAKGCCIAALVTQYACGLMLWIVASQQLFINASVRVALLCLAAALLATFCFWLGQQLTENVWIILSSIAVLTVIGLASQRTFIRKLLLLFYK